jgi:hypothetical protein
MHLWEGTPQLASGTMPYGSFDGHLAPSDLVPSDDDRVLSAGREDGRLRHASSGSGAGDEEQWQATAVVALGVLIGVPFLATGTLQGAWVQISHAITTLRR